MTISTGTEDHGGVTTVGDRCFLMANSHVGHDCHVGNDVIFANGAVLGGHVTIADHVFIGGNTAVHQFVRIGEGAMLGGMSGITRDIIPFGFAFGTEGRPGRAQCGRPEAAQVQPRPICIASATPIRCCSSARIRSPSACERTGTEFSGDPVVGKIVAFIREGGKRPPMMPAIDGGSRRSPTLTP